VQYFVKVSSAFFASYPEAGVVNAPIAVADMEKIKPAIKSKALFFNMNPSWFYEYA
jgi:hypothetical protein